MAEKDMRREAEIELDFPIEFDGEKISSLKMRRPKVFDSLKAEKHKGTDSERALYLYANLIERPVELLHELDESDLEKVIAQHSAFTGRQAAIHES